VLVFGARFAIEFLKESQEAFEAALALDMGQLLSLPVVLIGALLLSAAYGRLGGGNRPGRGRGNRADPLEVLHLWWR
jgi:prolipoprotein diacylglyceryltransferase